MFFSILFTHRCDPNFTLPSCKKTSRCISFKLGPGSVPWIATKQNTCKLLTYRAVTSMVCGYPSSPLHQVPFLFLDVDELDCLVKLANLVERRPFYFGGGFSLPNYIKTILDGVSAAQFAKIMVIQIRTFA